MTQHSITPGKDDQGRILAMCACGWKGMSGLTNPDSTPGVA